MDKMKVFIKVSESARDEMLDYVRSDCYLDAPSSEVCEIAARALQIIISEGRCSEIV